MKLAILLVLLLAGYATESAKILAVFPYRGRSHYIMFEPLMMGLARAGHSVDVVSHFPPEKSVPGLNHISLKGTLHMLVNNMTASAAQGMNTIFGALEFICNQEAISICNLIPLPQLQNIPNTIPKYDLMVTEIFGTNCFLGIAHKLKLPVIGVTTSSLYPWATDVFFDPDNPSYVPSQLSGFPSKMKFMQRVENLIYRMWAKLLFFYFDKTVSEPLARKYFDDLPSLNDLYYNISLVLANSHRSINGVRPTSPAVIEVAGLHIDETQELPKELEVFLNSANAGVIYFSMGSMVKSESFTNDTIQAIYDSFAELPNYKVLWKGKREEMPGRLPLNVKVVPWLPQYAVLRHPNVKAFVTHGGLMGTQEAIHAGVPMIGIPFFGDQMTNIAGYQEQGIAIQLDYGDLTKASFSYALREVLTNPKYKSNIERVSRLFKDRPLSPIDEAVYWVEYVIRNGGEPLKSSAAHLYWFQYYLIDVGLFLLAITTFVLIFIFILSKKILRYFIVTTQFASQEKMKTT